MKVLVRREDGSYYASKVFAVFRNVFDKKEYLSYSEKHLIFDETGNNLIIKSMFCRDPLDRSHRIKKILLIYDTDQSDMIIKKNGAGTVNFLTEKDIKNICSGHIEDEVLKKCKQYHTSYTGEYLEIKTDSDIQNLLTYAGGFHDARINKLTHISENEISVLFEDIFWGGEVELVFKGDVSYNYKETPDDYDGWFNGEVLFDGDHIIFTDACSYNKLGQLIKEPTWFKAKEAKYRIIPD